MHRDSPHTDLNTFSMLTGTPATALEDRLRQGTEASRPRLSAGHRPSIKKHAAEGTGIHAPGPGHVADAAAREVTPGRAPGGGRLGVLP